MAAARGGAAQEPAKEALYVDLRDEGQEALDEVRKLAKTGNWLKAVETAQRHITAPNGGLFETAPGIYVSFAERIRREVLSWPQLGLRTYQTRYGAAAAAVQARALRERSLADLSDVVRLYLPTSAGAQALAARAEIRLQRGELRAAMGDLERLARLPRPPPKGLAAKRSAVRAALARRAGAPLGADENWSTVGGNAAHHGFRAKPYRIGLPRWIFRVREADADHRVVAGLRARGRRVPLLTHPAISGDRVFVQTTQWIAALRRGTGETLWRHPRPPGPPTSRDIRDALPAPFVRGDRVFAFVAGEVVALSAATGARVWAVSDLTVERLPAAVEEKEAAPPEILVNSLAVADGKVFLCAAVAKQETECFALALDAQNGSVLWRAKLCSQVFRGHLGRGRHPAPPAFDQGVVYVSTNLGAVAAIEAETGEVRWLARYPAFPPARRRVALRADRCWENGPPVVCGGLLLAAPQDADHLLAFDIRTGERVWRAPRLGMRYLVGVADGRAYVSGIRAAAVDLTSGKLVWLAAGRLGPAGRPLLAGRSLFIPTTAALVELSTETGKRISRYRFDRRERTNLSLGGGLLLCAGADRIDAYADASDMPAHAATPAARFLRAERLDRLGDPAAPQRYRALLETLRDDDGPKADPALLAEVRAALAAAEQRRGAALAAAGKYDEAARALERARDHAPSPQKAAAAALAAAECRERQRRWNDAVDAYQRVIRTWRGVPFDVRSGIALPAEQVAESRIARIIRAHGPGVYRAHERRAAGLLARARETKDRKLLAAVAAEYPNSPQAAAARRELARTPGHGGRAELRRAWRTPFDLSRWSPLALPGADGLRCGEDAALVFATRDRGNPLTFMRDQVECRRRRDGRLLWRREIGHSLVRAHCDGDLLILRGLMHVVALDPSTGQVLWSTSKRGRIEIELGFGKTLEGKRIVDATAGAGKVFVARRSRRVLALDRKTGQEVWSKKLDQTVLAGSMCLIGRELALCGESPGGLYRLDAATGKQTAKVGFDRRDDRLTDPPARQRRARRICLVLGDRQVRNVDLATGKTLWTAEMPFSVGRIAATPDERRIVVLPDQWTLAGKVTCFDATTGRRLWTQAPQAKDPTRVHVGDDLVVSMKKNAFRDELVAQRTADGTAAWRRTLRVRPVIDTLTDAGDCFIAWGSREGLTGWRGWAALVRKADGAVLDTLTREGAGYSSVVASAGTMAFCSSRGIEAFRMGGGRTAGAALAALLDGGRDAPDEIRAPETARLLFTQGRYEAAMAWLDRVLLAEPPRPAAFASLHDQLMAIREAASERGRITYGAPRFRRPPKIDGRLCEDWRSDRGAVLDRPRHIECVKPPLTAQRFWQGPNDLSATLYVGWDDRRLYLAIDVNDDVQTTHDFDAAEWTGDCLMVSIDPECDGGYQLQGEDHVFWLALTAKQKKPRDDEDQQLGGEHRIKIKEDESGTVYELALPWADVGIERPRPGMRLGLNILVLDDDGGRHLKAVTWAPGLTQHRKKRVLSLGIAPSLFGTVILKER